MNKIEQQFFDAYLECEGISSDSECCSLEPDVQIDIYKADFVYDGIFVIEIDGHEYHKTKEQRFKDYTRERYLMHKGYIVIRFMGSEVFLNAEQCALEMLEIAGVFDEKKFDMFYEGLKSGREGR